MKTPTLLKLGLIPLLLVSAALPLQAALRFDGTNDYVSFGVASGLGATNFTIECWFKGQGAGVVTSTGTGGINTIPLVTKGRAENEAGATNMNYFLSVSTNNLLAADFEDKNNGLNHPISASANPSVSNSWQHAAVTYDQASGTWIIHLNGNPIATNIVSGAALVRTPEGASIEHAALASALTTTGAAAGFFAGSMEEVRIWNVARTSAQIAANKDLRIASAAGLIGRWPLTETNGTTASDTSGSAINGTLLNGPTWTTDSAFVPPPPTGTNLVFNFANQWRYMQTSNLDGTLWKQPAYNDAAWPAGQGVLGLEDCNCLPQPILTPLTLFTNRLTHYFRTHFSFGGNPASASLLFSNLVDNGAVFYLNGVEIQRVRMPAGTITDTTPASEGVGDATSYDTFMITGNLLTNLVVGDNVLAVEIHQADFSSSDVVFGSSLSVVTSGGGGAPGSGGLSFDGVDDMVTLGAAPGLGVTNFTIECWFKQQGAGKRANTGTSGLFAVPLVTKGMAENEAGVTNMNYFFGIGTNNAGQAVLAADFEDYNNGLNHPVRGTAIIGSNVWQHGAVTYNSASSNWVLYLNGVPDTTNIITGPTGITNLLMLIPRADSLQHAALGSSLRTGGSTNADSGFFSGTMDEVRIWNAARTAQQIADSYNLQITNASGLIARWALEETAGTTAGNSVSGGVNGTLANGPVWAAGYPFPVQSNAPPVAPVAVTPTNGAPNISTNATLTVTVSDPEASNLTVTYYGRVANAVSTPGADFTLLALPDTQHYSAGINGGLPDMFTNQTQWIVNNRVSRNIQYLAQLGDCVQNGDNNGNDAQWRVATNSLYRLENPITTQLPEGLPYGIAVGNHDQGTTGNGDPNGTTTFYNQYFGEAHFGGYNYYGDHYGANNDNHYDLFSASGLDFIVIYFEYNATMTTSSPIIAWANSVLATNQNRRAIVASHWIINAGFNATFSTQGQAIYDGLKGNTNLFLMLCGHVSPEEGQRTDTYQGRTVWTVMTDYQGRSGGGNGWLRLYEFSPSNNVIRATTYSPWLNQTETDSNSQFNIPYVMTAPNPFSVIGSSAGISSGANASMTWSNLTPGVQYEWYATVSDGVNTITGPVLSFTTASNAPPASPIITNQPASQTVQCGNNAILSVSATGAAPLNYQWYFDNAILSGETNASLSLIAVTGANMGSYLVTVQNIGGSITSTPALLTVNDTTAPVITVCATNITLNANANCQATIPDLTGQVSASDVCSIVTISQSPVVGTLVGLGDTLVTFTATDAASNSTTCSATITVVDLTAPIITTCATNITLNADTNCQATIPNLASHIVASDTCGSVTISQSPSAGTLVTLGNTLVTLTVADAATNLTTCSATITVVDAGPPVINAQPQSLTNIVCTTATFNIAATSCSSISYQWLLGTNLLSGATTSSLTITNLQLSHSGDYSVVLTNAAGTSTSSVASLTVMLPITPTLSVGPSILPNGHFFVGFSGSPNVPYTVEFASAISGPWQPLTNITSDINGLIPCEDFTTPSLPMRFYRIVYP